MVIVSSVVVVAGGGGCGSVKGCVVGVSGVWWEVGAESVVSEGFRGAEIMDL